MKSAAHAFSSHGYFSAEKFLVLAPVEPRKALQKHAQRTSIQIFFAVQYIAKQGVIFFMLKYGDG
jgi:hypothetical protein